MGYIMNLREKVGHGPLIVVGSTALFNKMIRSSNRNTRITALKPMIQELAGEDDDTEL